MCHIECWIANIHNCNDEDEPENKIIRGDNLEALKALLPQYEGRIKCIYIDLPYNTGNEGWVYNDNVNDPKIKKWLGQVVGREGEDLSRHDKWLCMMYPIFHGSVLTLHEMIPRALSTKWNIFLFSANNLIGIPISFREQRK